MRFLPALLLIAAPMLAQEPTEEQRQAEAERRAAEERALEAEQKQLAAEKAQYVKRAEELRRLADQRSKWGMSAMELKRLLDELRSKSEAKREEAMEALKRVNANLDELLPIIAEALETAERARGALAFDFLERPPTVFLGGVGGGSEVISGSADGTDYSLKSLGGGKYELNAARYADETKTKLMEKWQDQGTIKELQEKYAFLNALRAIQVPAAPAAHAGVVATDARGRVRTWAATPTTPHWEFQYVAWDGGGRVGVSVVAPSEDLRFHLQLPEGAGFIVQHVVPGSRAEQIGIRRMDILLKIDGELIDSPIQLKKLHEKAGVLEVIRRSEARKIDLATFPEWKPEIPPEKVEEKIGEERPSAPAGAR